MSNKKQFYTGLGLGIFTAFNLAMPKAPQAELAPCHTLKL